MSILRNINACLFDNVCVSVCPYLIAKFIVGARKIAELMSNVRISIL